MKLFAVYLGGDAHGSNIEVHDVVFAVGTSLESLFENLKSKWFGYPENSPHIDSYIQLDCADGYKIDLTSEKSAQEEKLYFLNFGGYTENLFGEVHQSAFYVAKSKPEAIRKARRDLCLGMIQPHLDNQHEVENLLEVDDIIEVDSVDGYHILLTPSAETVTPLAVPGYIKI